MEHVFFKTFDVRYYEVATFVRFNDVLFSVSKYFCNRYGSQSHVICRITKVAKQCVSNIMTSTKNLGNIARRITISWRVSSPTFIIRCLCVVFFEIDSPTKSQRTKYAPKVSRCVVLGPLSHPMVPRGVSGQKARFLVSKS